MSGQLGSAGEHLCLAVQVGQSSMHDLGARHGQSFVYSHGRRIPVSVWNVAVLPNIAGVLHSILNLRRCNFAQCRVLFGC